MTDATGTTPTPDETTPKRTKNRGMLIAGLVAGVVVLVIGIAAFATTRDGDDPQPTASEQVAVARQACQQWLDSDNAPTGPGAGWCGDMAGWMSGHMGDDQMMMGRGMWASPEAMRDVCTRATSDSQNAHGDPAQWCDQMVDWMGQHEGDWDDLHHNWDD